jgi:hypothetical protein
LTSFIAAFIAESQSTSFIAALVSVSTKVVLRSIRSLVSVKKDCPSVGVTARSLSSSSRRRISTRLVIVFACISARDLIDRVVWLQRQQYDASDRFGRAVRYEACRLIGVSARGLSVRVRRHIGTRLVGSGR